MKDITVKEIIKTFKGVERKLILSTAETDDFLDAMKNKKYWTIEEYKELYYEFAKAYKNKNPIDSLAFFQVTNNNNFKTNWNDYLHILDSLETLEKQKEYIDYYFWYHGSTLNENYYQIIASKEYFSGVSDKSKIRYIESNLKINENNNWIDKYFSKEIIQQGLEKHGLFFNIVDEHFQYDKNKEDEVKSFYLKYKDLMNNKTKFKILNKAVERGSLELIKFFYKEQKIKVLNKKHLLWYVCADTASANVIEVLNELQELGLKFNENDLNRVQNHGQWGYMENKDKLLLFFKSLKAQKDYVKLNKKLKPKREVKIKTKKI